ncbi:MAG: C25 family cysteine peptidase [Candidatus Cloacimonetes bacterium]|nr:C25 family cysteine peptidase [Candidatus Cloacimonadota bacterium]
MERRLFILIILLLLSLSLWSERINLNSKENVLQVLHSSPSETILQYTVSKFDTKETTINGENWFHISLPGEGVTQEKGLPELPVFNRSIIIDNSAQMKLEIFDVEYTDMRFAIAPSKGVITRNIDPKSVPYTFSDFYTKSDFYPANIAKLSEPYIMRDFRGITVITTPFAYNPATKILRVYHSYKIRVYQEGTDSINVLQQTRSIISRTFSGIYQNHFVNWNNYRYTPVDDSYGKLLVICHSNFLSAIEPWVNWKRQKGVETELVEWSTIGSTASQLQNYIQTRYNQDNSLTYVQIVGDAPQIPTISYQGGGSDPTFSLVAGSDFYPDIFIGRFSAENTSQLSIQLNRSITYERDAATTDTWLTRATGIASDQGGGSQGDNGESDIQHMNNIRTKLLNYGYTSVDQIYDPGASASTVSTNINAGRGFLNYVGHGSTTAWGTTGFSVTNAMNLSNGSKTPFIVDVACINGNFVSNTCFAEGWMRSPNGGAITIYASTINQSWNSPMRAQDEVTDLWIAEAKSTAGGYYYSGSCKMMDVYGNTASSDGVNMFKTWHIFGDASLMVRSKTPIAMNPSHPDQIPMGSASLSITNAAPNALASLTCNNQIYARGFANSSGSISLPLGGLPAQAMDFTLTVTAYNRVTYVGIVQQTSASGPFMNVENTQYADANNQIPEYGDNANLNVTFKNTGTASVSNLVSTLSAETPGIILTDASEALGNLAAGATILRNNAFSFSIANNIPDGTIAEFNIMMQSGASTWNHQFTLEINAPALNFGTYSISDPTGNNNGMLDPGETVSLSIPVLNNGTAASPSGTASLSSNTPEITINSGNVSFPAIAAGGSALANFSITTATSVPQGTLANLSFSASAGAYSVAENLAIQVGTPPEVIIGDGSSSTSTNSASPINIWYKSLHGQSVYTAAELNTAGIYGPVEISQLGFNITGLPANAMPNFVVRMKHTSATNAANWIDASNLVTYYSNPSYLPTQIGWNLYSLSTPFIWNGTDNILIDTAFGLLTDYHQSGTVECTTVTDGYRFTRNDSYDQTNVFSNGSTSNTRPNLKLVFYSTQVDQAQISVNPVSISETVIYGNSVAHNITISNTGSAELMWSIPERNAATRAMTGSTLSSNVSSYAPGTTSSWTFTVTNNSPDNEWVRDIDIAFPASVTVNSVTSFSGGQYPLTANLQNGTGVTINWHYSDSSNYGGIYPDETATATVNVTINSTTSGDLNLPWIINGDDYGDDPHSVSGTLVFAQNGNPQPDDWFSINTHSGVIAPGEDTLITITLNSEGLDEGTYTSSFTIDSNATNNPTLSVPLSLTVEIPVNPLPVVPRFVAEWEPAQGAVVRYPFGQPYSLLADLSEDALLYVIVASTSQSSANSALQSNGVNMTNVHYINAPSDSYWVRDYGPWTIFDDEGEMHLVDFNYNRPRPNDNAIPTVIANYLETNLYDLDMNHTGGNIMTDGMGKAMSTELVLSENSSLSQNQINQRFSDYLGISEYQIYTDPTSTYIDHIDCWAKLLDVDKVMIRRVPSGHTQFTAIEASVSQWQAKTSSYGTPYRIFRVDTPNDEPYTNAFIMNGKIYVPQMGTANDAAALSAYQNAMPGFEVSGYTYASYASTDALHCRVNTIFDEQMISVRHTPPENLMAYTDYTISVEIDHLNPLDPIGSFIKWSTSPEGPWNLKPLIAVDYNTWSTPLSIPAVENLYYYIHTQDNSGRITKLPLCAELDPFVIPVQQNPAMPSWPTVTYSNPPATVHAVVSVMGNPAQVGDLVGAFVGEECRGTALVYMSRNTMVSIQIQLAESGESVSFKVFSQADGKIYDSDLQVNPSIGESLGIEAPLDIICALAEPIVAITMQENQFSLSWNEIPNATAYQILVSDNPYSGFSVLHQTVNSHISLPIDSDRIFFKVLALKENPTKRN